jgi:hypothetical protein
MEDIKIQPGKVYMHKVTHKRCVVIRINDDDTIKVRDEDNKEQDYYRQELGEIPPLIG